MRPASLAWPLDPQGSASFGSVPSEEFALKITALCVLCPHRLIRSNFQPCRPFNTWTVKPDDSLRGFRRQRGLILPPGHSPPQNSLAPGLMHLLEAARSKLLIPRAWPENHCPCSHLTPWIRTNKCQPTRLTLLVTRWEGVWSSLEKKGYSGAELHYSQQSKNTVFKLQDPLAVSAVELCIGAQELQFAGPAAQAALRHFMADLLR